MWRDACGVVGLQGGDVEEKCGTGIVTQCEWGRRRWKGGKRGWCLTGELTPVLL